MTKAFPLFVAIAILAGGCARGHGPGDPAAKVVDGWNYFRQGDYIAATEAFDDAIAAPDRHGDDASSRPLRLKALYGLAQVWDLGRRDADPGRAPALYHQIIQLDPTSDEAAWSLLALARMQHVVPVGQEPDLPAVRKSYQDVIDRFPNHPAAQEAFIYQQSTLVSALDPDLARQSLPLLTAFVRDHPDSKFVSPAWGLIAVCQTTLGDAQKSLQADLKSFESREVDPTNPFLDNAAPYWHLATTAEFSVGDFETARKYYRKLIAEYPGDQKVFPASQALTRMDDLERSIASERQNAVSSRGDHGP